MTSHQFDRGAWASMTMFEQMGNIGSEVGRAFKAKQQNDEKRIQAAFYRGLDLIDATAALWASHSGGRVRELLRAREEFVRSMLGGDDDPSLEEYFMNFAIAARLSA